MVFTNHKCKYTHPCVCVYIYIYIYIYTRVCVYIDLCVCMFRLLSCVYKWYLPTINLLVISPCFLLCPHFHLWWSTLMLFFPWKKKSLWLTDNPCKWLTLTRYICAIFITSSLGSLLYSQGFLHSNVFFIITCPISALIACFFEWSFFQNKSSLSRTNRK